MGASTNPCCVALVVAGLLLAPACSSDGSSGDDAQQSAAATTSTTAAAAAPASECDLFTARDISDAIGAEVQDGVEDFECSYALASGAGGVDVNFVAADNASGSGEDEYRSEAQGEDVTIAGAQEAKYATFDTTGDITVTGQTLYVLTDGGSEITIRLRGEDVPQVTADQLVPAVEAAIAALEPA